MTTSEGNADTVVEIEAGGVHVILNGPRVTSGEALAVWQLVRDQLGSVVEIGSGTSITAERAAPPVSSGWLGEDGMRAVEKSAGDVRSAAGRAAAERMGFTVPQKPQVEFRDAPAFGTPEARRVECFHPFPCHCKRMSL